MQILFLSFPTAWSGLDLRFCHPWAYDCCMFANTVPQVDKGQLKKQLILDRLKNKILTTLFYFN